MEDLELQALRNRVIFQIQTVQGAITTVDKLSVKPDQIVRVLAAIQKKQDENRDKLARKGFYG